MKFIVPAAVLALVAATSVGCKHNNTKAAAPAEPSPAVTDITPLPPSAAQQNQAPVVVQPAPVNEAPMKASTSGGSKAPITGKKYTVQAGDTLFNIATRRYGHATTANLTKIRNANPSIKGDMLKVGQVLTLP